MTSARKVIRAACAGLVVLLLAGCASRGGGSRTPQAGRSAAGSVASSASSPTRPAPVVSLAGEAAALDAVAVARAFTAAICPYSWRDPVPYGQRLDAALARWGTPAFRQAHRWSPARTATAAAGLAERHAQQACGQVTGGLEPEADPASGTVAVRLSVTVTAQAADSAASSAQETFNLQLARRDGRWLISSGQW